MSDKYCSHCNAKIVPARGNSDLLIVGTAPDEIDISKGSPFSSSNTGFFDRISAGKILRKELERVGLSINDFRVMHLWKHEPNKLEECWQDGFDTVLSEAKGKKAILLIGADAVEAFTGYKVSDVSGLRVDSSILSAPLIMAMVSPGLAMSRSVGEVRHGITKWQQALEKENLI